MAGPSTGPFVFAERVTGEKLYINAANVTYVDDARGGSCVHFTGSEESIIVKLTAQQLVIKIQNAIVSEHQADEEE